MQHGVQSRTTEGFRRLSPRPLQAGLWCRCVRAATGCELELATNTRQIMQRAQTLDAYLTPAGGLIHASSFSLLTNHSLCELHLSFAMGGLRHRLMRSSPRGPGDHESRLNPALLEACGDPAGFLDRPAYQRCSLASSFLLG